MLATNNTPKTLYSRLLYPFYYPKAGLQRCIQQLTANNQWQLLDAPPFQYQDELFSSAYDFIFSKQSAYLKINTRYTDQWFRKNIQVALPIKSANGFRLRLLPKVGIELFLSHSGVGLLSIAFEVILPKTPHANLNDYKLYNYYLTQLQRRPTAPIFSITHPFEQTNFKGDRDKIAPIPDADAPFTKRLGKAGGRFYLAELCDFLLQDITECHALQKQFSLYSVLRFDQNVDFSQPDVQKQYGALLSGLTQIEEINHAGHSRNDPLTIVNQRLNRCHWVGLSVMGAVHFISDQGVAFDQQRPATVMRKYFIPYLMVYMQRLILQRFLHEAQQLLSQQPTASKLCQQGFAQLHNELLDFNVRGQFTEVSHRAALNRYYGLAQTNFSIAQHSQQVKEAIGHYDANVLATGLAQSIKQISKVQSSVEWFEVLFIIGAATQLADYVGKTTGNACYSKLSLIILPLVAGLAALFILKPWKTNPDYQQKKGTIFTGIAVVIVLFICWWIISLFVISPAENVPTCDDFSTIWASLFD